MKKTKNSALFDTLYGLLIVFALVGVIGIFGGISSAFPDSNNGGTSNVEPEEELFTIEAGVYTFDELIAPDSFHYKEIPLVFTCSYTNSSGNSIYLEAESIKFYRDIVLGDWSYDNIDYGCTSYLFDGESSLNGYTSIYTCKRTVGSNVYSSEWGYDGYRTITVPYDQQVDASAGKWFSTYTTRESVSDDSGSTEDGAFGETPEYKENTIYAGTYRWNDVIARIEHDFNIPIKFQCEPVIIEAIEIRDYIGIWTYFDDDVFRLVYITADEYNNIPVPVYETSLSGDSKNWNAANIQYTDSFPQGFGQTFTITEDTEVDDTFYTWFTLNTTMLIKAGTYRWNDTLTELSNFDDLTKIPLNFSVANSLIVDETNKTVTFSNTPKTYYGVCLNNKNFFDVSSLSFIIDEEQTQGEYVYFDYESVYWNGAKLFYEELGGFTVDPEVNNYGQIITVTEDTYVPAYFGAWFVCNAAKWEAAETDTSEATATILNIPFNEVLYIPTNKKDLMSA